MFAGPLFRCLSMAALCFGLWIVLISIHEAFERCLSVIFVYPTHCFSHLSHPFVVSFFKKKKKPPRLFFFLLRDTLQRWDSWDSVQTQTSVQFWRRRRHLLLFVKTVQTFQKETLCYCVCGTPGYCAIHVNMFTKWSLPLWQHHRKSKPGQRGLNGEPGRKRSGGEAELVWPDYDPLHVPLDHFITVYYYFPLRGPKGSSRKWVKFIEGPQRKYTLLLCV